MPAPVASKFEDDIRAELRSNGFLTANIDGVQYDANFTGAWDLFIKALTTCWMEAWQKWQDGHICCPGNTIPVLAGKSNPFGSGGAIKETVVIDFIIKWPFRRHPRFFEFEEALVTVLRKEFSLFSNTYVVSKLPYAGSSSHTAITPGSFNITNIPTPIGEAGSGDPPDKIRPQVEAILEGKGWRVKNPFYRTGLFLDAIEVALEKNFAEWLEKTKIIGDTSSGPAAPGAGVGVGTSLETGKLV